MGPKKHTNVWTNPKINISKCGWVLHSLEYHLYFPLSIRNLNQLAKLYCHGLHSHPLTPLVWAHYRPSLIWDVFTSELPQTDCQELPLRDSRPESGARSEGWATAESELSDSGSNARGRSKCTTGQEGELQNACQSQGDQQKLSRLKSMLYCWESSKAKYIILISLSVWGGRGGEAEPFHHHCVLSLTPRASQKLDLQDEMRDLSYYC